MLFGYSKLPVLNAVIDLSSRLVYNGFTMRKIINKLVAAFVLMFVLAFFAGCNPNDLGTQSFTDDQKKEIVDASNKLVDDKGSIYDALENYKKLVQFEKVDSDARKKTLRYMLDKSLEMVNSEDLQIVQQAFDFAIELDKVYPNNFYVQNRMMIAYNRFAREAMKKKDWATAYDFLYTKALKLRFDDDIMRTYLDLRNLMAEEAIANKKYDEALEFLKEVYSIANIKENEALYKQQQAKAQLLFKKLPAEYQKKI